jgi:hypothetical protein
MLTDTIQPSAQSPASPTPRQRGRPWLVAALGAMLALAVFLQWLGSMGGGAPAETRKVAEILPVVVQGWESVDKDLADSPGEKAAQSELLNYDDAVFRVYSPSERGSASFAIYLAHWNPGRMSPRLVAGHTPDVCWPAAGWVRQPAEEGLAGGDGQTENVAVSQMLSAAGLPPGQFRVFELQGDTEHLVFWHVFGDELVNYDTTSAPPWYAMFSDLFKRGLNQRREQWFIRISSPEPLSRLGRDAGFQAVLAKLREAGLGKVPGSGKG